MKKIIITIIITVIVTLLIEILVVIGLGVYKFNFTDDDIHLTNEGNNVACTMEAKLCPDGSAVGRSGPNCEFAPCPGE